MPACPQCGIDRKSLETPCSICGHVVENAPPPPAPPPPPEQPKKKDERSGSFLGAVLGNAGGIDAQKVGEKYRQLFIDGESVELAFKLFRDVFIFTNKRLIIIDIQGITGKKTEYLSIPYKSITRFSIETAGHFDLDAELKLWVGSGGYCLEKKFNKKVNIYDIHRILAKHVLGGF